MLLTRLTTEFLPQDIFWRFVEVCFTLCDFQCLDPESPIIFNKEMFLSRILIFDIRVRRVLWYSRFPILDRGSLQYCFSDCGIKKLTSLLVEYLLLYLWKPKKFDFVKVVWCFHYFEFPTFLLSDIGNIAFDLLCIYFFDVRVSEIRSFTLDKIEGFFWKQDLPAFLIPDFRYSESRKPETPHFFRLNVCFPITDSRFLKLKMKLNFVNFSLCIRNIQFRVFWPFELGFWRFEFTINFYHCYSYFFTLLRVCLQCITFVS